MIKITDLASVLMEQHGLTKNEADFFIPLFVDVLTTGLKTDKQVKIKGLGTFKVTAVNARESVDVNTGERIRIEGRDKISFTPENALRDRVNSPFEQFETVTVGDDVDFSEIDERYSELESDDVVQQMPSDEVSRQLDDETENVLEAPQSEASESVEQSEKTVVTEIEEEETKADHMVDEAGVDDLPLIVPLHAAVVEETAEEDVMPETAEVLPEKVHTPLVEEQEKATVEYGEIAELNENNRLLTENLERTQRNQKILIATVLVLLLVVCVGGVYIAKQFSLRDNRIEHLMAELVSAKQPADKEKVTVPTTDGHPEESSENLTLQDEAPKTTTAKSVNPEKADEPLKTETKPQAATEKPVEQKQESKPQTVKAEAGSSKYDADPRIRTGAYVITGVAQRVTAQAGQTLASISKAHLGPGMECYIEAVNDNKEIKAGDKVNIPELRLKKKAK